VRHDPPMYGYMRSCVYVSMHVSVWMDRERVLASTRTHTLLHALMHTNVPSFGKCPMVLVAGPDGGRLLRIETGVAENEDVAKGQSSPALSLSFLLTLSIHTGIPSAP
jgi:hypothetical protein